MSRTFNFGQSQNLLDVDSKTFGRWLKKAKIDPSKQVNRADPREKLLTDEQILMLAKEHGRDVHFPPLDQEDESEAEVSLATVDKRLTALEQLIAQRFGDLQRELADLGQRITAPLSSQIGPEPTPTSFSPPTEAKSSPTRAPTRARAKQKTRGKQLPSAFTPLRVFAELHGVPIKTADRASKAAKMAVRRGRWLHKSRYITEALDARGKQDFYELFHERGGFQRCKGCPHAL